MTERVLVVLLLVAMFIGAAIWMEVADTRCAEKGGVYLWREAKCIKGIEEVK